MNNAKNILLYIFLYACVLISIGYLLRSGITELRVDVCFNVSRCLSNISKVVGPIYILLSAVHGSSCCSTFSPTLGTVNILIFAVLNSVRVS